MANILVAYHQSTYPPRATIEDHLYAFARHSGARCYYLNLARRRVPRYLKGVAFDLIVFHTTLLSRWNRPAFEKLMCRAEPLRALSGRRIALPQDEFINTDLLGEFLRRFGVEHIFSVAPPSEWPLIYADVDRDRVRFSSVLTGYLEEETVARIDALAARSVAPGTDIGYRAWRAEAWLGRHGYLKTRIADEVIVRAPAHDLTTDISTRPEDTLLGDDWYRFLLGCRWTVGVEGGAGVLDRDGSIRDRTQAFARQHPTASFDEVEAACFPNLDGTLRLFAISPRQLEACATRTGQILVEGAYNGVLQAEEHYLPVARDLSNLDDVLAESRREEKRSAIVERARRDVVDSGRYTYRRFVQDVLTATFGASAAGVVHARSHAPARWHRRAKAADRVSWGVAAAGHRIRHTWAFDAMRRLLPLRARLLVHAALRAAGTMLGRAS